MVTFMMFKPCLAPSDQFLCDITQILIQANAILRQEYQNFLVTSSGFDVQYKADRSAVTQADLRVNSYLVQALQRLTPSYPILSEEGEHLQRKHWDTFWLVDPLDGTQEFLSKRPDFTVNLSLVQAGKTVFSAISVPEKELVYIGYLEQKPLRYYEQEKTWASYQCMNNMATEQSNIKVGLSHRSESPRMQHFLKKLAEIKSLTIVRCGSAYKFCLMLEGQIDLYPRFHPTSEWDTSAGQGLLESIGGGLLSTKNEPFIYNQRETLLNNDFIAFTAPNYAKDAFLAKVASSLL